MATMNAGEKATVAVIGTCDTKLDELLYLCDEIEAHGVKTLLVDVGKTPSEHKAINVTQQQLLRHHNGATPSDRGEFIDQIAKCATASTQELIGGHEIDGIVSAGGSGGTSLASSVMRALPPGFPKLIVSTIASGDTGPIIGDTDITLMYSIVDIAGLNGMLRQVLSNAGGAIAGAAKSYHRRGDLSTDKKRIGITMFGVTTPCVDAIRKHLETHYPVETYVFHATGTGGRSMERLIRAGQLDAVIDLTTTEVCDYIMGGVMSAGEGRLDAAVEKGIPCIVSLGAVDMANFGARDTVPKKYEGRKIVEHNALVTLVRSSPDECRAIAEFVCRKLNGADVQVWLPLGGVSMLAVPDGPFADEDADHALFDAIRKGLPGQVVEDERHINDDGFAVDIAEAMARKLGLAKQPICSVDD